MSSGVQVAGRTRYDHPDIVVAASDSLDEHTADIICTGVDDQLFIEQAFDTLPALGGTVLLMAGNYATTREIRIENKDNWILSGQGKGTKIKIADKVESALTENGVLGADTVTVTDITGFKVDQTVFIRDDNSDLGVDESGWDREVIQSIAGNVITIVGTLSQNYTTALHSSVTTAYDVLRIDTCDNIVVQDLQIDGNKANQITGAKGRRSQNGIGLFSVDNSIVERCYSHDVPNLTIRVDTCEHTLVTKNRLTDSYRGMCMYNSCIGIMASFNISSGHTSNGFRFCSACDSGYYFNEAFDCAAPGIRVNNPGGSGNTTIFGNRSHDNTYGIKIVAVVPGSDRIFVSNNIVYDNSNTGIYLGAMIDSVVSNNQIFNNTTMGIATYSGCNSNIISDNHLKDNGIREIKILAGNNNNIYGNKLIGTGGHGIHIETGTGNRIHDNEIEGSTSIITDAGTNTIIRNNIGFVTENTGTATILSATTSIAVTHGLDKTPAAGDIMITPAESIGNANSFWVDTYTATQFTINVDAAPGADTDFIWVANVR